MQVTADGFKSEDGNDAMYAEERQQALVTAARHDGRVVVSEAAQRYGVTTETIRRDLAALDDRGLLTRVHGGAVPTESLQLVEHPLPERVVSFADEKAAIGRAALAHLPHGPGSSIVVDAGTTTGQLAALLPAAPELTILTNSVTNAAVASTRCLGPVQLLGGRVRGLTQATVGAEAVRTLAATRVDVLFLGTNGLTLGHGCSTPDAEEAAVKAAMVRSARRVVVLTDSSKIGAELLRSFATIAEIDVLITDSAIADGDREAFSDNGIEVVIA